MLFEASLIRVIDCTPEGKKDLEINCMHVKGPYWIFEGDIDFIGEGIKLEIVEEGIVPSLGGLSERELIKVCKESFDVNVRKLVKEALSDA